MLGRGLSRPARERCGERDDGHAGARERRVPLRGAERRRHARLRAHADGRGPVLGQQCGRTARRRPGAHRLPPRPHRRRRPTPDRHHRQSRRSYLRHRARWRGVVLGSQRGRRARRRRRSRGLLLRRRLRSTADTGRGRTPLPLDQRRRWLHVRRHARRRARLLGSAAVGLGPLDRARCATGRCRASGLHRVTGRQPLVRLRCATGLNRARSLTHHAPRSRIGTRSHPVRRNTHQPLWRIP